MREINPFRTLLWLAGALVWGFSAVVWAADEGPKDMHYTGRVTDPVQVCMVKRTVQPHTTLTYDYQGKTYHFCCSNCLSKFKANPDHLKLAIDPVNGKPVDKAEGLIYSYEGHAYFFASKRTLKKFSKKPAKYLTKYPQAGT
jgi:YHS domain-containing protein